MTRSPLIRLGLFYFLLFSSIGAFLPWFPPLLAQRGFSPAWIGIGMSLGSLCRALLPPFWGSIADRLSAMNHLLAGAVFVSGLSLCALAVTSDPYLTLALLLLNGLALVPVFPIAETLALETLATRPAAYGRIRLWGSAGFILTAQGLGWFSLSQTPDLAAWAAGLPLVAAAALAWLIAPSPPAAHHPPQLGPNHPKPSLPWRQFLPLIAAAALGQGAHGPYYTFFTLDLANSGVGSGLIGLLWSWGVVAEIVLMAFSPRIFARFSLTRTLQWGLFLGALRWGLFALRPPVWVLAAGQALHAGSFALLHIAAVQIADQLSPPGRKAFGQSWLSAMAYGIGGGGGIYISGLLFDRLGLPRLYALAAVASLVGWSLALAIKEPRNDSSQAARSK